jgi:hypothetical protein
VPFAQLPAGAALASAVADYSRGAGICNRSAAVGLVSNIGRLPSLRQFSCLTESFTAIIVAPHQYG